MEFDIYIYLINYLLTQSHIDSYIIKIPEYHNKNC